MRLSVVVPCHNAEAWLGQTLGSLLEQTRLPDEVIVVDDASTDGSRGVAAAFVIDDPDRFSLIAPEVGGNAPAARNLGAERATGEAIMFLDADDVLHPETLEALAAALDSGDAGLAVCPWRRLELDGDGDERWVSRPASCRPRRADEDPLDAWLTGWYHPPCSVLWSTKAYRQTGGWDPRATVNNDGDLVMRALVDGVEVVKAERGCGYYRRLPDGQSSISGKRTTEAGLAARLYVLRKLALRLEQAGRIEAHRAALAEAAWLVRREALPGFGDVAEAATKSALTFGPGRMARLRGRWRRRQPPAEAASAVDPATGSDDTSVTAGLDAAARVMDHAGGATTQAEGGLKMAITGDTGATPALLTVIRRPAVSAIIPTYNRSDTVTAAIRSVLDQTFTDLELLVVDDASSDDTEAVCRGIDDKRLRYVRQERNRGVAAARNRGILESRGRYLAWLDSDDAWKPDRLTKQVELMERSPATVGLIYSGTERIDETGQVSVRLPEDHHRGDLADAMLRENVVYGGCGNALMRREVVAAAGFFDPSLPAIEDYDFFLRVCQFVEADFVPEALAVYRDEGVEGRRSRQVEANLRAREMFYDKHAAAMQRAGAAEAFLLETARRYLHPTVIDAAAAARLADRARRLAPGSREAWGTLKWALALWARQGFHASPADGSGVPR